MNVRWLAAYLVATIVGWFLADWIFGGMRRVEEMWAARVAGMLVAGVLIWAVQRLRSAAN